MSRIGKIPIECKGAKITVSPTEVVVQGSKNTLKVSYDKLDLVEVKFEDDKLIVSRKVESSDSRREQGLIRALLQNAVTGVTTGFTKDLEINGVGYKAEVKGKILLLNLGFSHPVEFPIPDGLEMKADRTKISVHGADKWLVGETAARIRRVRPPEPYKGKGVCYAGEYIRRKVGKAAAGAAGG
ncbi:MAG: 50S ribosomal protein L6 [Pseudomonadota bacterium]